MRILQELQATLAVTRTELRLSKPAQQRKAEIQHQLSELRPKLAANAEKAKLAKEEWERYQSYVASQSQKEAKLVAEAEELDARTVPDNSDPVEDELLRKLAAHRASKQGAVDAGGTASPRAGNPSAKVDNGSGSALLPSARTPAPPADRTQSAWARVDSELHPALLDIVGAEPEVAPDTRKARGAASMPY